MDRLPVQAAGRMATSIFVFTLLIMVAQTTVPGPLWANPRVSGRIVKIIPASKLVVLQRADGKHVRVLMRQGSLFQRTGAEVTLGRFRAGDYVVVEIAGALNDDPLDGQALMDITSAGRAPSATSNPVQPTTGTFPTVGGVSAAMPNMPSVSAVGLGGSQNVPGMGVPGMSDYQPRWNPTQPWAGVGTDPGSPLPDVNATITANNRQVMSRPPSTGNPATVNAYGQGVQPQQSVIPGSTGGTMTAAPAPYAAPWTAQVMSAQTQPQQVSMPSNSAPGSALNPYGPSTPASQNDPFGTAGGTAPQGPQVVTLQGAVTQIDLNRRMFTMQSSLSGRQTVVTVSVPAQVPVILSQSRKLSGLESVKRGSYLQVSGIMSIGGLVEARKIMLNQ